jgi:hypothetical protein
MVLEGKNKWVTILGLGEWSMLHYLITMKKSIKCGEFVAQKINIYSFVPIYTRIFSHSF